LTICIVDTSVFCNILDVPAYNQDRAHALSTLERFLDERYTLLLPLAAVFETGNHIAQLADSGARRETALRFVDQVGKAIAGEAPWTPTPFPDQGRLAEWLTEFPDCSMRGIGLADLSIIKELERQRDLHRMRRAFVWAYDDHLRASCPPPCGPAFGCSKSLPPILCPSCGARRMVESAALLVDEVFPEQPVRQWGEGRPFVRWTNAARRTPGQEVRAGTTRHGWLLALWSEDKRQPPSGHGPGARHRLSCDRQPPDPQGRAHSQDRTHRRGHADPALRQCAQPQPPLAWRTSLCATLRATCDRVNRHSCRFVIGCSSMGSMSWGPTERSSGFAG